MGLSSRIFVVVGIAAAASACSSGSTARPTSTSALTTTTVVERATTTTAVPLSLVTALDLHRGSAFGFASGQHVDPETVAAALTPLLGAPTRDTGWYLTESRSEEDCLGGQQQRILRWGTLSYAFWKQVVEGNPQYTLWSWVVGDINASGWGDRREPAPIELKPAIPATTVDGDGIGTKLAVLQRRFGPGTIQLSDDHRTAYLGLGGAAGNVQLIIANETVTGIAGTMGFC